MGQENTNPRKINKIEGALGQVMKSGGPGNVETWGYEDYGLSFEGTVTGIAGAPNFQCSGLAGFGDGYFKNFYVLVVWDSAGGGAAPQGEMLECTAYSSATGDFTVAAFTASIAVGDKVLLLNQSQAATLNTVFGLAALKTLVDDLETRLTALRAGYLDDLARLTATTIDLNQAAATYDLFTGTTQVVILESLNIKMPTGAAGGALTSISIQTDDATAGVIISSADGDVANLTSEADLGWVGTLYITVGTKIQLTIAGGAHGVAYVCNVTAKFRAVVSGGYLA